MSLSISQFIERKLWAYDKEHTGIAIQDPVDKFSAAMNRAKERLNKVEILIDDEPLSAIEVARIKAQIPDIFKREKVMYEATATHLFGDGSIAGQTSFGIEVIN